MDHPSSTIPPPDTEPRPETDGAGGVQDWAARLTRLKQLLASPAPATRAPFDAYLTAALEAFGLKTGLITEAKDGRLRILAASGADPRLQAGATLPLDETLAGEAIRTRQPLALHTVGQTPAYADHPLYRTFGFESYLGAPIHVGAEVFGTISLMDTRPYARPFDAADIAYIELFAQAIGTNIRAGRFDRERIEINRQRREATSLFQTAFSHAPVGMALVDLDGRFLKVNAALCDLVGYSEGDLLTRTFQQLTYPDDLDLDMGLLQECLAGQRSQYAMEKRYIHRTGRTIWTQLNVALVRTDEGAPRYFVSQIQSVDAEKRLITQLDLRQKELEEANRKLTDMAHLDPLTGVYNRRALRNLLEEHVKAALATRQPLAFLMADVDHFKAYNDSYGHIEGDQALQQIVRACVGALRPGDVIGRFGGEEFLILLPQTTGEQAMAVAERLRAAVAGSTEMRRTVTVSIGAHIFEPDREPARIEALIARADMALYQAKQKGRNRVEAQ